MFGFVGNLTAIPKLREAEAADARFGLGTHQAIQENTDQESSQDQKTQTSDDSAAEFSTLSLIKFLESFLEDRLGKLPESHSDEDIIQSRWLDKRSANQNIAKKAIQAYSHAAEIARGRLQKTPQEADLRVVYALLQDLRRLHERGVNVLSVHQDQSFLRSVREAVDQAFLSKE